MCVLDLDETLVHSQFNPVEGYDFSVEVFEDNMSRLLSKDNYSKYMSLCDQVLNYSLNNLVNTMI